MLNQELWAAHFPQFIDNWDKGIQLLMDSSTLVTIPARQQIFYPGGLCENYLLVLEGEVRIQILSESGREILLYHVRPGDSCVLTTSCLLSGDAYPAEGITENVVTAFLISAHAFHRGIEQSSFFREFVFKNFSTRLSKLIGRMEAVVFGTIDQRLSGALLECGTKEIAKTHQELASELGTAREVVSRHLKNFESYGWVKLKRGTVEIINFEALKRLSDSAES